MYESVVDRNKKVLKHKDDTLKTGIASWCFSTFLFLEAAFPIMTAVASGLS